MKKAKILDVDMDNNELQKVCKKARYPIKMDLSGPSITLDSVDFFDHLPPNTLKEANLSSNEISEIINISTQKKLKRLIADRNKIKAIDCTGLVSLEHLSLAHNKLTSLPILDDLIKCHTIILRGNRLTEGFEHLRAVKMLRVLDLSNNGIDLSMNQLFEKLLWPLTDLPKLQQLNLEGNPIVIKVRNFRAFVVHELVLLETLNNTKITKAEKATATKMHQQGLFADKNKEEKIFDEILSDEEKEVPLATIEDEFDVDPNSLMGSSNTQQISLDTSSDAMMMMDCLRAPQSDSMSSLLDPSNLLDSPFHPDAFKSPRSPTNPTNPSNRNTNNNNNNNDPTEFDFDALELDDQIFADILLQDTKKTESAATETFEELLSAFTQKKTRIDDRVFGDSTKDAKDLVIPASTDDIFDQLINNVANNLSLDDDDGNTGSGSSKKNTFVIPDSFTAINPSAASDRLKRLKEEEDKLEHELQQQERLKEQESELMKRIEEKRNLLMRHQQPTVVNDPTSTPKPTPLAPVQVESIPRAELEKPTLVAMHQPVTTIRHLPPPSEPESGVGTSAHAPILPNPRDNYRDMVTEKNATNYVPRNQPIPAFIIDKDKLGGVELLTPEYVHSGFGTCYKANYLGRTVVMKQLKSHQFPNTQHFIQQFRNETQYLMTLSHPGVATVYGGSVSTRTHEAVYYSEYIEGKSLHDLLYDQANPRMNILQKFEIAQQLADAICYLHSCNVLVYGLKPTKIIIDPKGQVHLRGFGFHCLKDVCTSGGNISSPQYYPPEALEGHPLSIKMDVYSFAMVLWELFEEEQPFADVPPYRVFVHVVRDAVRPDEPADCPLVVWKIIQACWQPAQQTRPGFDKLCMIFHQPFETILQQGVTHAHPVRRATPSTSSTASSVRAVTSTPVASLAIAESGSGGGGGRDEKVVPSPPVSVSAFEGIDPNTILNTVNSLLGSIEALSILKGIKILTKFVSESEEHYRLVQQREPLFAFCFTTLNKLHDNIAQSNATSTTTGGIALSQDEANLLAVLCMLFVALCEYETACALLVDRHVPSTTVSLFVHVANHQLSFPPATSSDTLVISKLLQLITTLWKQTATQPHILDGANEFIPVLSNLLLSTSADMSVKVMAIASVAVFVEHTSIQQLFVDSHIQAIKTLVQLMQSAHPMMQFHALVSLAYLSLSPKLAPLVTKLDVLPKLLLMLCSPTPVVRIQTLNAFERLARNETMRIELSKHNTMTLLSELLRSTDADTVCAVLRCVVHFLVDKANLVHFKNAQSFIVTVKLLDPTTSTSPTLLAHAFSFYERFVMYSSLHVQIAQSLGVATACLKLMNDTGASCSSSNGVTLDVQRSALNILVVLSAHTPLSSQSFLASLKLALRSPAATSSLASTSLRAAHYNALLSLLPLKDASTAESKFFPVEEDATQSEALVQAMISDMLNEDFPPTVRHPAAIILSLLASRTHVRTAMLQSGGFPRILDVLVHLSDEHLSWKELIIASLPHYLNDQAANKQILLATNILDELVLLKTNGNRTMSLVASKSIDLLTQ